MAATSDPSQLQSGLRALGELARAVSEAPHDVEDLLRRICAVLAGSFGLQRVVMHRYVAETGEIVPLVAFGRDRFIRPTPYPIAEEPLLERALEAGEAVFIDDVRAAEALSPEVIADYGARSVVSAPLLVEGRCLGFMSGDRGGAPFDFDETERALLTTFASIGAVFLEKAIEQSELERLNQLKNQFVALASHELRTPVSSIYGAAATLAARWDDLGDGDRRRLVQMLAEQSSRMRMLVDQLLDFSRLEEGSLRIRPESLDVRQRLELLVTELAGDRAGEVVLDVPEGLVAEADPNAFDRMVSNLITNALRYGVAPVTIAAERGERQLRLSVEDRGPGVPAEFVPRLFERFTRSERSDGGVQGAGLGLAIARAFAEAHGGELGYRPALPHGARFEIVLPSLS